MLIYINKIELNESKKYDLHYVNITNQMSFKTYF